ncbi:MAG: autotransporter domain-containing protein [Azonexus sp.]|jgi:outer membrane autotransporter protein|nr:autotransporter domain-containing protein [Azonexus sp.]
MRHPVPFRLTRLAMLIGVIGASAVASPAFAQCAVGATPTTAPTSGQTVTCSGISTAPVNAAAGSTGVTINIGSSAAINGAHDNTFSIVLVSVDKASVINNYGDLTLSGAGGSSARGVAMLGVGDPDLAVSNRLYNYGTISTSGAYNTGMGASGGGNVLYNELGGIITTTGQYAYGIASGWTPGNNIEGPTFNTLNNDGFVQVSGSNSRAGSIVGSDSTLNNNGTLLATGNGSVGVYLNGTRDVLNNTGLIQSTGNNLAASNAYAVNVNMVGGTLTATINNSASGKIVSANASAIKLSGGTTILENGGLIEGGGATPVAIEGNTNNNLDLKLRVTSQIIGDVIGGGGTNTLTLLAQDATPLTGVVNNAFINFKTLTVGDAVNTANWNWQGSGVFADAITVQNGAKLSLQGSGTLGAPIVTVQGNGTFELGGLALVNGVLKLQAAGALAAGTVVNLADAGSTLLFNHTASNASPYQFTNTIGGAGKVVVQSGTTSLGANNGYSGGTYLNGGVLQVSSDNNLGDATGGLIFNGGTLNNTANVTLADTRVITLNSGGGTFDTNTGTTLTINNLNNGNGIIGSGGLTKTGGGTLQLSTSNSYTGGTTINAGVLNASASGALGSGALTVNTGGTLNLGSNTQAVSSLSGTGGSITGGGAGLAVNQSTNTTWAGTFNLGIGSLLTKDGIGTLTLTGAGSSVYNVGINDGTLAFEQSGAFTVSNNYTAADGTTTVIGPNANLAVTQLFDIGNSTLNVTIGGNSSATAAVTANKATITGANLNISGYNGDTFRVIETTDPNGVTGIFANTFIGGATAATVDYLLVQATYTANAVDVALGLSWLNADTTQAHGTFTLSAQGESFDVGAVLTNRSGESFSYDHLVTGVWDGNTLTKNGFGTLILSADNTYTGNTLINGGTLQIGNGGATGSIDAASDVVMSNDSALAFNRSDTALIVGNHITGDGKVEQIGSGKTTLTNSNDYTGGTSVLNGTLQLGVDGGAAGSITGAVTVDGGGSGSLFRIENSDTSGISTIDNSNRGITQFATGQNADDIGITNSNLGITWFSGNSTAGNTSTNAYATINNLGNGVTFGATFFDDTSSAVSATINNDGGGVTFFGTNPFNPDASGTLNSTASAGSATITNSNGGGVYFTAKSNAGNATITNDSGGLAQFTTDSSAADATITNNDGGRTDFFGNSTAGNATITNQSGGETDFFGNSRGGNASITNEGGRTYFVGNADPVNAALKNDGTGSAFDFSGTTGAAGNNKISAGSIEGDGRFLLGSNQLTVGSNGLDTAVSGVISDGGYNGGTGGSLVKIGTGTLTLSGSNTYSGGTTISDGKIIGTATSFGSGAIANNAALEIAQPTDAAFANDLSGAGTFTKSGAGTLYYLGDGSTFTGATTVAAGALMVLNGDATPTTLNSIITVNSNATMGGDGTIGGLHALGGSTIVPGNGIGTLNVNGNVTFEIGSIFAVELNPTQGDLLHSTGTTTINGGTVKVLAGSGNYAANKDYTIITADGGRGGVGFADVTTNLAYLKPTLTYPGTTDVVLTMTRNDRSFGGDGTPNQRAAGAGVESVGSGVIYDAITNLTADQALAAFDQLSGEIHASLQTAMLEDSRFIREAAINRLGAANQRDSGVWVRAFGSWGKWDGDGNAAGLDRAIGGLFVGADALVTGNVRLGAVAGYSRAGIDVDNRRSTATRDDYHLGVYGGATWGDWSWRSGAAYTWHDFSTTRRVAFPGFADRLKADYHAATAQVFGELGLAVQAGNFRLEPFANLAYVNLRANGFSERGGAAALTARANSEDMTFSTLGVHAASDLPIGNINARFKGTLGWRHALNGVTPDATLRFAGGSAFSIAGVPIERNAAVLDIGLDFALSKTATVGVAYNGQFGSGARDQSVQVNVAVSF